MLMRSWTLPASTSLLPSGLPQDALLLAEAPDTVALCRLDDIPNPTYPWSRVDVFNADWNLRVHRMGTQIRAVAIGQVPGIDTWGEPDAQTSLQEAEAQTTRVVLWGRKNPGESMWLELRVPHLMTVENRLHPDGHGADSDSKMVRRYLTMVRYEEGEEGYRYTGLQYAHGNEEDSTFDPVKDT